MILNPYCRRDEKMLASRSIADLLRIIKIELSTCTNIGDALGEFPDRTPVSIDGINVADYSKHFPLIFK